MLDVPTIESPMEHHRRSRGHRRRCRRRRHRRRRRQDRRRLRRDDATGQGASKFTLIGKPKILQGLHFDSQLLK